MCPADLCEVPGANQVDARAHDVVQPRAGLDEGLLDDLETPARLAVGIDRRLAPSAMTGAQPETSTRSPTRTARE